MHYFPLRQSHVQTFLHDEPPTIRLPLLLRLDKFHVILQEEGGDEFGPVGEVSEKVPHRQKKTILDSHLHPTNIPPQTHPRARTKCEEKPLHISISSAFSFGFLNPPLGSESLNFVSEYLFVPVDDPRVGADSSASGDEAAGDRGA